VAVSLSDVLVARYLWEPPPHHEKDRLVRQGAVVGLHFRDRPPLPVSFLAAAEIQQILADLDQRDDLYEPSPVLCFTDGAGETVQFHVTGLTLLTAPARWVLEGESDDPDEDSTGAGDDYLVNTLQNGG